MQNAPREHSAILSTFIKLPSVIKIFVLSIFEWPLKAGFTVLLANYTGTSQRTKVLNSGSEIEECGLMVKITAAELLLETTRYYYQQKSFLLAALSPQAFLSE